MPKGKQKPVAYRCVEPFAYYGDGTGAPRYYGSGQVVPATDPILKTHRHAFTDAFPEDEQIERATQAPGERRNIIPPRSDDSDTDGADEEKEQSDE